MTKIKGSPPIKHHYDQNLELPNSTPAEIETRRFILQNSQTSSSASQINSSRVGFDSGTYRKNEIELQYQKEKGKKGLGWGKGGKRAAIEEAERAIEKAIQKALEEQARLEEIRQQEIKQEEIKSEQIKEDIQKDWIKDTDQNLTDRKDIQKRKRLETDRLTPHETRRG